MFIFAVSLNVHYEIIKTNFVNFSVYFWLTASNKFEKSSSFWNFRRSDTGGNKSRKDKTSSSIDYK